MTDNEQVQLAKFALDAIRMEGFRAAAAENERCAAICEKLAKTSSLSLDVLMAEKCAREIRKPIKSKWASARNR